MSKPHLYDFTGSTYARTVRMLLAEKGAAYDSTQVNVLEGEPQKPEHLARHPFGKVPVLDHDGRRILETTAICGYVDAAFDGPSFVPTDPWDRARMDMTTSFVDAYGYKAMVWDVAIQHLFPDAVGGMDEAKLDKGKNDATKLLTYLMTMKGDSPWLAGAERSVADFYLAPCCAYVAMTPEAEKLFDVHGFGDWWSTVQGLESFRSTAPDMG